MTDKPVFNLGEYVTPKMMRERAAAGRELARLKKWCEDYDTAVKTLVDGFAELNIDGRRVAHISPGQFAEKKFRLEQPGIASQYTKTVTQEVLDVEAFKAAHPALHEKYVARKFIIDRSWQDGEQQ